MLRPLAVTLLQALLAPVACGADSPQPVTKEWKVGGDTRQALVYAPPTATEKPTPLVFAFHGHGGTMTAAARSFAIQKHWPEAICIYMQGLPTPG